MEDREMRATYKLCAAEGSSNRSAARRGSPLRLLACGFLALGCLQMTATAADLGAAISPPAPPAGVDSGWRFNASAYIWMLEFSGEVRTIPPLPAVNVDVGFKDILKKLDGALMGSFEARFDRILLFSDIIFTRISLDRSFSPQGIPLDVSFGTRSFIGLAAAGYRLVDYNGWILDAFAGARGFAVHSEIDLNTPLGGVAFAKDKAWLDATAGARIRYDFNKNWFVHAIGFAGGGASKYHLDLYGGVGYAFSGNWAAFAGYRALKVNYRDGYFIYDALQQGPLLGVTYSF